MFPSFNVSPLSGLQGQREGTPPDCTQRNGNSNAYPHYLSVWRGARRWETPSRRQSRRSKRAILTPSWDSRSAVALPARRRGTGLRGQVGKPDGGKAINLPSPTEGMALQRGMGDEGQGEAMVRANGAGVCSRRGETLRSGAGQGEMAGRGCSKRGSRTRVARVCGEFGWPDGGSVADGRRQAGSGIARSRATGASELGFPRPALGQMQGKAAR